MKTDILGVDIGGVIINGRGENADTMFSDRFLETPPVAGVFAALRRLNDERFNGRIYLVSKCGESVQQKTLQWLDSYKFYELTGVQPENVHYCRLRHQKAGICSELGITHFVDDRLEILGYVTTVAYRYLFDPNPSEVERFKSLLPIVHKTVKRWDEIVDDLL